MSGTGPETNIQFFYYFTRTTDFDLSGKETTGLYYLSTSEHASPAQSYLDI